MIITFDKPKKIRNTEVHNRMHTSDSGIAGTYVPNMSEADMNKWRAKHIKGDDERIEIRKTINGVQVLIVVFKKPRHVKWNYNNQDEWRKRHENIKISMNGTLDMTDEEYKELRAAIEDAQVIFTMKPK
jgi:hypothetical protein